MLLTPRLLLGAGPSLPVCRWWWWWHYHRAMQDERLKAVEREYLHKDHAQVLKHMKHLLPAPLHKRVEAALAKAAAEAAGKKTEEVTQGEEDEALPLTGQSGEEGANSDANKGGHGLKEEQEEDDHEDSKVRGTAERGQGRAQGADRPVVPHDA